MGSLEAMVKGSDARYLGDMSRLKIAQGVSGSVAAKGSVSRLLPYTMHAVKQGFQDLGTRSIAAAHDALADGVIRLEVCTSQPVTLLDQFAYPVSPCVLTGLQTNVQPFYVHKQIHSRIDNNMPFSEDLGFTREPHLCIVLGHLASAEWGGWYTFWIYELCSCGGR